jgi:hypothetical protein
MKVFAGIGGIDLFLCILLELDQIEVLQALAGAEGIAGTFGGGFAGGFSGTPGWTFVDCFCHRMVLGKIN